jgi:hypothetical protein
MSTATSKNGASIGFDKIGAGPALILIDAAGGFRGFGPMQPLASDASDQRLLGWSRGLADALPAASFRAVNGTWHGVSEEALAPILKDFFCS